MDQNDPRVPIGSNATCWLVAAGVSVALQLLQQGRIPIGMHRPETLEADGTWTRSLGTRIPLHWTME